MDRKGKATELEALWREQNDEKVKEAASHLTDYTEEATQIIRAQMLKRGIPPPPPPTASVSQDQQQLSKSPVQETDQSKVRETKKASEHNMVQDFLDKSADWLLGVSIGAGFLSPLFIVGWQGLSWLRTGRWIALPLRKAFEYFEVDLTRIYNPTDWYGLATIAQWFLDWPLAICVPVVTVGAAFTWIVFVWSLQDS